MFLCASASPERPFPKESIASFQKALLSCSEAVSEFMTKPSKGKRQIKALLSKINKKMLKETLYNKDGIPWGVDVIILLRYPKELKVGVIGAMALYRRDLHGWFDLLDNDRYEDDIHTVDSLGSHRDLDVEFFTFELTRQDEGDLILCNSDGISALEYSPLTVYYDQGVEVLRSLPLQSQPYIERWVSSFFAAIPVEAQRRQPPPLFQ